MSKKITEKRMADIEIGQKAEFSKTISESDVYLFAGLTGDFNQIHVDLEYAKNTRFGQRLVHGFLTASLIQNCTSALTTPGGVSLRYSFDTKAPVFIGDTITATAEVVEKRTDKPIVILKIACQKQDGTICIEGRADIYMISEKNDS